MLEQDENNQRHSPNHITTCTGEFILRYDPGIGENQEPDEASV